MKESVHLLGKYATVVGLFTPAQQQDTQVTALIFNAGLVHHVGPGGLHVRLARQLASAGIPTWRMDFSGLGDSPPRPDHMPQLQQMTDEPIEIMDQIQRQWGSEKFILIGICSGAFASFKTTCKDHRVLASVMINPQDFVGDEDWAPYVRAQHYMTKSFYNPRAWLNLITGRVNYTRLWRVLWQQVTRGLLGANKQAKTRAESVREQLTSICDRQVHILLVLSESDVSLADMGAVLGCDLRELEQGYLQTALIQEADHLFTRKKDQDALISAIEQWIQKLAWVQETELETLEI